MLFASCSGLVALCFGSVPRIKDSINHPFCIVICIVRKFYSCAPPQGPTPTQANFFTKMVFPIINACIWLCILLPLNAKTVACNKHTFHTRRHQITSCHGARCAKYSTKEQQTHVRKGQANETLPYVQPQISRHGSEVAGRRALNAAI